MKLSIGPTWLRLFLENQVGQSMDDPLECQRVYAAITQREAEDSSWLVGGKQIYIEVDLDDLYEASLWFHKTYSPHMKSPQRETTRRNAARILRRAVRLDQSRPFTELVVQRRSDLPAYRAFKDGPGSYRKPYHPIRALCTHGVREEGVMWPFKIIQPPYRQYIYRFVPTSEIPPVEEVTLAIRPHRNPSALVR